MLISFNGQVPELGSVGIEVDEIRPQVRIVSARGTGGDRGQCLCSIADPVCWNNVTQEGLAVTVGVCGQRIIDCDRVTLCILGVAQISVPHSLGGHALAILITYVETLLQGPQSLEGHKPEALATPVVQARNVDGPASRRPIFVPNKLSRFEDAELASDWIRKVLTPANAQAARVVAMSFKEAAMNRVRSTAG